MSENRPRVNASQVLNDIRSRIMSGAWPRGNLVPTRVELARSLGVGIQTVQKVMSHLQSDGFLEVHGRLGTSVPKRLPCDYRIALVFPALMRRSQFLAALQMAATQVQAADQLEIRTYLCDSQEDVVRSGLVADARDQCLGGIISVFREHQFIEALVPDVPCVDLGVSGDVHLDDAAMTMGIKHLVRQGRRRIVLFTYLHDSNGAEQHLAHMRRLGASRSSTLIHCDFEKGWAIRYLCRVLMRGGSERPNGLFITDDNFVEPVTLGLADAGPKALRGVTVMAHANFPLPPRAHVPVSWIGYDCRTMVRECLTLLREIREGRPRRQIIISSHLEGP